MLAGPKRAQAWVGLAVIAAAACAPVGSLGKDYPADTSGTGATSSDTSAEESSTTAGGSASTSDGDSTTGMTPHATSTESGTTGEHLCPTSMRDTTCTACTNATCCTELTSCNADPVCTCLHDCHAAGTPIATCTAKCGDDGGLNEAFEQCVHMMCTPPCA